MGLIGDVVSPFISPWTSLLGVGQGQSSAQGAAGAQGAEGEEGAGESSSPQSGTSSGSASGDSPPQVNLQDTFDWKTFDPATVSGSGTGSGATSGS